MLDLVEKVGRAGTVSRIIAPVGIQEMSVGREQKIATELEHVFPNLSAVRPPAVQDQAQVSREYTPPEEHRPPPAIKTEVAVGLTVGVTHRRQGKRSGGYCLGTRLCNDQNFRPSTTDLFEMVSHLHEVRQTGYSPQVPEKDYQQQPRKLG